MVDPCDPLIKQLELLLGGYGFNYYKLENQLRADDLLIRQRIGASLGNAAKKLELMGSEFQRRCIPAPTREQPYPSAALMDRLREARSLRQRVMDQAMLIHGAPAPAQDKIWRRLRHEGGLLEILLQADIEMIQLAVSIEQAAATMTAEQWKSVGVENAILASLDRLDMAINSRRGLLEIQPNR